MELEYSCKLDDKLQDTPCGRVDVALVKLNKGIPVRPGVPEFNKGLEAPENVDETSMDMYLEYSVSDVIFFF